MDDNRLRLLTLNIGSWLDPGWDERRHLVVAGLNELAPDVVCFQEVCQSDTRPNSAEWVAEAAKETWHTVFGGFAPKVDEPGMLFGSAVLSRFPIDSHVVHRLPVGPNPEPMLLDAGWELLHAKTAGLDIFSTHLAPAPHQTLDRQAQVAAIDLLIRQARGLKDYSNNWADRSEMPPILCGDFNAEADSDEIRFLCGYTTLDGRATFYQDAWRTGGDGSAGFTNDWHISPLAARLNVHRKRIDYIFVGDPFVRTGAGGRVLETRRVFDTPDNDGQTASDHCGLLMECVWPTRPELPAA